MDGQADTATETTRHGSRRLTAEHGSDDGAERRESEFESARKLASLEGLPSYGAWRTALERRYTVMPSWYWNESKCRQNYSAHIRTTLDWQEEQSRLNRGMSKFLRSIAVPS